MKPSTKPDICYRCYKPVEYRYVAGEWKPFNKDGSEHHCAASGASR